VKKQEATIIAFPLALCSGRNNICPSFLDLALWVRPRDSDGGDYDKEFISNLSPPCQTPNHSSTPTYSLTMSQIPSILSPYLALPSETSLILLTSVLGASTNWLALRYLYSYLRQPSNTSRREVGIGSDGNTIGEGQGDVQTKVLLVSFLRDLAFWRESARKLVSRYFTSHFGYYIPLYLRRDAIWRRHTERD
jgi:hypothetical protein